MNIPRPNFTHHPLAWLAGSFAVGIIFSNWIDPSYLISLFAGIALLLAAVARIGSRYVPYFVLFAFFFAGAFLESIEVHSVRTDRVRSIYDAGAIRSGEPVEIEGVLSGTPEESIDGFFLLLRAENLTHNSTEQRVSGVVRLFAVSPGGQFVADYTALHLRYGTRVRIACEVEREDQFQNPGVVSRVSILDQQGIDATCTIKSPLLIEVLGRESVFLPLASVYEQRQKLISQFRQYFSVSTAGVLAASLLGDKYFLEKHVAEVFREGGTFHVLVISGLHITFIGALIALLLRLFTRNRFWQFAIASILLWAFTLAVGAEVPVVRATVMFMILAFSRVVKRQGTLLNSFGLCTLLLLVWRPGDLFTASFQLTFTSVLTIIVVAFPLVETIRAIGKWTPTKREPFPASVPDWLRRICEKLYWRDEAWLIQAKQQLWSARLYKIAKPQRPFSETLRSVVAYIFEGVLVSLVVQISLLPIVITYFHRISVLSVVTNLWVGFFIALESFSAIISVLASQINSTLALPFIRLTEGFEWLLVSVPGWFVDGRWASFRLPAYSGPLRVAYLLYFVPIAICAFQIFRWDPFGFGIKITGRFRLPVHAAAISFTVLLAIIVFHPFSAPSPDNKLHVDFLDVGQGDSALVTFPDGETLLVDGGGRRSIGTSNTEDGVAFEPDTQSIGEEVVSAFLWHKGYSKIDYILATHGDADHIQGLSDVAENFSVGQAFFGRTPEANPNFAKLAAILRKRNVPFTTIAQGDKFELGGVTVNTLYPLPDDSVDAVSDNDHSVVLLLTFGERKVLMTGDVERKAESDLLSIPDFLRADVVKVAHHGSRTSSTQAFVDAAKPGSAIISVGRHSVFGHPHPEVVQRWKDSGAETLTTGKSGTITIVTDGRSLELSTFVK